MNKIIEKPKRQADLDIQLTGLAYGLTGALTFSIITWGIDAVHMATISAGFPWLKFFIGSLLCMLVGGLVGWLTARLDSTLFGVVGWLAAGIVFAWIASRLPFEWLSTIIRLLDPKLGEILSYPFPENVRIRLVVVYGIVGVCSLLAGALELIIVDSASRAHSTFMRFLTLVACVPLFALAGFVTVEYINQPMSSAITAVDNLIQSGLKYENKPIDKQTLRDLHLRSLEPIKHLIHRPYRLYIESYQQEYFDEFNILIDFDGIWARCTAVVNSVMLCKLLDEGASPSIQSQQTVISDTGQQAILLTATPPPLPLKTPLIQTPVESPLAQTEFPQDLQSAPRYVLSLAVNYEQRSFSGQAQILYTNSENVPLEQLYFHLLPNGSASYGNGRLELDSLKINGQPVDPFTSGKDTIMQVKLPSSLQPGEHVNLEMSFSGEVPLDFGGENGSGYGIYNFTKGVLALSGWYPILAVYDEHGWNLDIPSYLGDSVYSDIAYYTVDLSVPEDLVVAATGVEVERKAEGGLSRIRFESGPARDFFLVMSPDFQSISKTVDGTTVNSYFLPGHSNAASTALNITADTLSIFNDQFGPYPYTELDLVDAPMKNASGVEFPGIFLVGTSLYDTPEDPRFTVTTAHETAHQWWYNVIGNDVFDNPWMDEALATYSSSLYYEFQYSPSATQGLYDYWQQRHDETVNQGLDDQITLPLSYFEGLANPGVYGRIVYIKGALFFMALRQEIGDEAFFTALRDYYQQFLYRIATPDDMLNLFEEATNRQLDDFYQDWLYSPPSPK